MTENSKIFLTKNTIYNILAQQELSIGLSLYIIKDIKQQLEQMYNNIIQQEMSQQKEKEDKEKKQAEQKEEKNNNKQIIDMSSFGAYPVKWTPEEKENEDQAD